MTLTRISLVLSLSLVLASCGGSKETATPAPADTKAVTPAAPDSHESLKEVRIADEMMRDLRVTTTAVESRRGGDDILLLGDLAINETGYAEVGAPVPARVSRLLAGLGDLVAKGQPLFELESPEFGRARAEYLSAVGRQTLADNSLKRKQSLAAERITPQREVQEAEAELTAARAAVRSATASLQAMGLPVPEENATQTSPTVVLRSPVGGTVIERKASLGQMLDPNAPAFRVSDLSSLWLVGHAFERDAVRIRKGAVARVTFAALPGEQFRGDVALVGSQVERESRTVDVRIVVRNPKGTLKPGMSASASLPVGSGDAAILTVPVASVQRVGENWCVFLPKEKGVFEIRQIGRGRDLGSEVEIISGLKAGEVVVVEGAFLLKSQAAKGDGGHEEK